MTTINPYLTFNGNAEEAFNFYKSAFGGDFTILQRFKDMPGEQTIAEEDEEKILHISLPIGKENTLMASDFMSSMEQQEALTIGSNVAISIQAANKADADKLFNRLSADGQVQMPIQDTFWNAYFGMFTDKFGIHWLVNYDYASDSDN